MSNGFRAHSTTGLWEYRSSSTATTTGSFATVTGWTAVHDIPGYWSSFAGGVVTMSDAGVFLVHASVGFASTTGRELIGIFVNGTEYDRSGTHAAAIQNYPAITVPVPLKVGDTLEVRCAQSSGSSIALAPVGQGHLFSMMNLTSRR